jgi:hypothetical protein
LKIKCHLTFCRTSYAHAKEDPFVVKAVNRIWRYSGNLINTVVFMIYLKKELLRAYASSSSIYVLCVITLWQRSNAWQGQSSVQEMVNETCIFCGFKRSKCLKGCFYLWITLIKKNYKGSHEMYNAHSYLVTDKIQTYNKIPVSIKQWPWPKVIPIYVIMTFIYVSLYFVYVLFDTRK